MALKHEQENSQMSTLTETLRSNLNNPVSSPEFGIHDCNVTNRRGHCYLFNIRVKLSPKHTIIPGLHTGPNLMQIYYS